MAVRIFPLTRFVTQSVLFLLSAAPGCSSSDNADKSGADDTAGSHSGGTAGHGAGGGAGTPGAGGSGGGGRTTSGTGDANGPRVALSLRTTDLGGCQLDAGYFDVPAVADGHPVDLSGASALEATDPSDPGAMHSTKVECSFSSGYFRATIWNKGIGLLINLQIGSTATALGESMSFDFTETGSANEFHGKDAEPCVGSMHYTTATSALVEVACAKVYGTSPEGVTDAAPTCSLAKGYVYLEGCTQE
jgi:hypothetical protein